MSLPNPSFPHPHPLPIRPDRSGAVNTTSALGRLGVVLTAPRSRRARPHRLQTPMTSTPRHQGWVWCHHLHQAQPPPSAKGIDTHAKPHSNQDYAAPVGSQAAGAAFKDTWTLSGLEVAWMGLIADEQPATAQVLKTAGLAYGKGNAVVLDDDGRSANRDGTYAERHRKHLPALRLYG